MNYAYTRVSAKDQNLQRQIAAFCEFGIEKSRIFSEKKSGKDFERKEYKRLLKNENKELQDTIANEKAMQINYSYADIRKWLSHFRTLDYSKTKNRKDLIDTFIYRVILYDDKMKVLFHLKGGQQGELLLNLIFPDYPDGHGDDGENAQKMPENEKETDKAVSNSDINAECAYTSRLVE